jgi:hypothetical protein
MNKLILGAAFGAILKRGIGLSHGMTRVGLLGADSQRSPELSDSAGTNKEFSHHLALHEVAGIE